MDIHVAVEFNHLCKRILILVTPFVYGSYKINSLSKTYILTFNHMGVIGWQITVQLLQNITLQTL